MLQSKLGRCVDVMLIFLYTYMQINLQAEMFKDDISTNSFALATHANDKIKQVILSY